MRVMSLLLVSVLAASFSSGCGSSPMSAFEAMVVRDGDRVRASGSVQVYPGAPTRLCAPGIELAIWPPAPCRHYVELAGLRPEQIAGAQEDQGMTFGRADVEGVYRAGTLTVDKVREHAGPPPAGITRPGTPVLETVRTFAADKANGVYLFSTEPTPKLQLVVMTPKLAATLSAPDFDGVDISAWLQPVR